MFRVLVVDDEQIVLDAVKFIIEKRQGDVTVCGTANTGREAIDKAKRLQPDIVFMDIRMPGISGIDAIREIKHLSPHVRFVIISAYEQFEFAKQAVQLGVSDYLLKPINRHRLNDILDQLTLEISEEQKQREQELATMEKLQKMVPYIENSFIYAVMSNSCDVNELHRYFKLLDVECDYGYMMILQLRSDEALSLHEHYHQIRDLIKYKTSALIGPLMFNKIIVFNPKRKVGTDYEHRVDSMELGECLRHEIERLTGIKCTIGIGSIQAVKELYYSYGQAQKSLSRAEQDTVVHVEDLYARNDCHEALIKMQRNLTDAVEKGQLNKAIKCFDEIYQIIAENRERILELVVLIYKVAQDEGVTPDAVLRYESYLNDCIQIDNQQDLQRWIVNRIKYIIEKINLEKNQKCSYLVEKSKRIIEMEYATEVTLEGVSRSLNVSPQYLSRLFKEDIGQTFIEYLTHIRISHAKDLMKRCNKTVKEICYEVGYSDPNYFSRIFKKQTGKMPTEYMQYEKKAYLGEIHESR